MISKEKIITFLERFILSLCGLAIFLRLLLFWFLIAYAGPDTHIDRGLLLGLPSEFVALFVYIIFFLFLIKLTLQKGTVNLNIPITMFLLGLLAVSLLSLIYSVNKDSTLRFAWNFLAHIYLFFILFDCLNTHQRIKIFIFLLLAAGLTTALKGLYHYFYIYGYVLDYPGIQADDYRIRGILQLKRISTFFGWPNLMAGFLSMILPLNIVCTVLTRHRREKVYMAIAAIIVLLATIFTYSIGALLSLFIAGITTYILYARKRSFLKSVKAKIVLTAVILLVVISALAVINKRSDKLTAGSFIARKIYLKGAISMIRDNPILGTGAGTFKDVFSAYISRAIEYARHAHNSFLEFWTDLGIAGFLIFSSFAIYILYSTGSRLKKEQEPQKRLLLAGLFCSSIVFLIHNVVSFTIFAPMVSFYWWIILSLAFAFIGLRPLATKQAFIIKRIFISSGMLSILISSIFLCRQFVADIYFFKAENLRYDRQDIDTIIKNLEISKKLNPFDSRYVKSLGDLYFGEFRRTGKGILLDKAIEEYKYSVKLDTRDGIGYHNLAIGYSIKGERELADRFHKKALQYKPYIKSISGSGPRETGLKIR